MFVAGFSTRQANIFTIKFSSTIGVVNAKVKVVAVKRHQSASRVIRLRDAVRNTSMYVMITMDIHATIYRALITVANIAIVLAGTLVSPSVHPITAVLIGSDTQKL